MNKKIGVVITDGVGYRNFILSNFLTEASNSFKEIIIYSGLKKSIYNLSSFANVKVIELDVYEESKQAWFFRRINELAHLYKYKSFYGMQDTLEMTKPKGFSKRDILNRGIRFFVSIFHSEKNMKWYQKLVYKSLAKNELTQKLISIIDKSKIDIIFFTHQRPPYIAPVAYAAKHNKIKTCSFIFSWDNLASKGRMPVLFDSFLVWSNLMKQELLYFYPSVKKENIHIVGTPQFEPYVIEQYKLSKKEFYKRFNIDDKKKTICFSCGDNVTGVNDELTIEIISEAIKTNKIFEDVNLIVRTSPADDGEKFNDLIQKYEFISWNKPKWELTRKNHPETWSQRIPLKEDVKELRAILEYSDLSINMCSTMSLDFMIFDKPVINQTLGSKTNGLFNDQKYLNYAHYKKVVESGAVNIVKTKEELIESINTALKKPLEKKKERKELLNLQMGGNSLKGTSKRIVSALKSI